MKRVNTSTRGKHKMLLNIRDLSVLAYANGFTLWHYKQGGVGIDKVMEGNFFADASDMMAVGDMILCSGIDGGKLLVVRLTENGRVITASLS